MSREMLLSHNDNDKNTDTGKDTHNDRRKLSVNAGRVMGVEIRREDTSG